MESWHGLVIMLAPLQMRAASMSSPQDMLTGRALTEPLAHLELPAGMHASLSESRGTSDRSRRSYAFSALMAWRTPPPARSSMRRPYQSAASLMAFAEPIQV